MVNILALTAKASTYVKVANFPGLYRHARSGRYYACKKLGGVRRERSLGTCDRKIAERRLKEWVGNLDKVDAEVTVAGFAFTPPDHSLTSLWIVCTIPYSRTDRNGG